jgi:TfoX/Sxy family transcriptional regulator of competence genes
MENYPSSIRTLITEKKMFGGLAFLLQGRMTVGIIKDELMVRIIQEKMDGILKIPAVRPMDFTNKPMKEFIFVSPEGFRTNEQLQYWTELGIEHARRKLTL